MAGDKARSHGVSNSKPASAAVVLVLIVSSIPLTAAAVESSPRPLDESSRIAGFQWGPEQAATFGPFNDSKPQVYFDASGQLHFLYRSMAPSDGYWYARVGSDGQLAQRGTFITSNVIAGWGDQFQLGPTIGLDSQSNIHVAYDDGGSNIYYAKYDTDGDVVVAQRLVAPEDGSSSDTPSLAVGVDDTIHIVNEDYKFQCEDIVYHKLQNDGTAIFNNHVVSSDLATHAEFSSIETDHYSGSVLVSFGSATGTWLARMDRYGVKNMASIKVRPETDYKILDLAAAPDGRMDAAWSQNDTVLYSAFDKTSFGLADQMRVSGTAGSAPGVPRIEAMEDGRSAIVWDELVMGVRQVFISVVAFNATGAASISRPEQLTNSSEGARDPWLAVGPDGNLVVAFAETSSGTSSIRYRATSVCALELYADPISLDDLFFLHPNRTQTMDLYVKNKGMIESDIDVSMNVSSGAAARGWDVSLSDSWFPGMKRQEVRNLTLTIRPPADAQQNENISVELTAHISCDSSAVDSIDIPMFVKVSRSLLLTLSPSLVAVDPGAVVTVMAAVTNRGDTVEPLVHVGPDRSSLPTGWSVGPEVGQVTLGPGESATVNFTLGVSQGAIAGSDPSVRFIAWSDVDSSVVSVESVRFGIAARALLDLLEPANISVVPGTLAQVTFEALVSSNLASPPLVTFEGAQEGQAPWNFSLSKLSSGTYWPASSRARLSVVVPLGTLAGVSRTFTVHAALEGTGANDSAQVTVSASTVHQLEYGVSAFSGMVTAGAPFFADVSVSNFGNVDETLSTSLVSAPTGWTVSADGMSPGGRQMTLPPSHSDAIRIQIRAPTTAIAGTYKIELQSMNAAGAARPVVFLLTIPPASILALGVNVDSLRVPAGQSATYYLTVANLGNTPDQFGISVIGLPQALDYTLWHVRAPPGQPIPVDEGAFVPVGVGEGEILALEVHVPLDWAGTTAEFSIALNSALGASGDLFLTLHQVVPELVPKVASFSPVRPDAGAAVAATIAVENKGEADAHAVLVELYDNGHYAGREVVPLIQAGSKAYVSVTWEPMEGSHVVTVVVDGDPHGGPGKIIESDETNNEAQGQFEVGRPLTTGLGAMPFWLIGGAAVVAVVAALAVRRRR